MLRHASWSPGLENATVLDVFAGTGALGLEALSRGAAQASFIEQDHAALDALRSNIAACRAEARSRVIAGDARRPPTGRPCGLVFLDPPYGHDLVPLALAALEGAGWIAKNAVIVAELGRADTMPTVGVKLEERVHGAARLVIWRSNAG